MSLDVVRLGSLITSLSVRGYQVTTDRYESEGLNPIVDQGQKLICGYTAAPTLPCRLPVTVFGDHTREVKFIDFPFVVGADGTKVLEASAEQHPRYLNALIEYAASHMASLGYSRHYKELREAEVPYIADPDEQRRIGTVLATWDKGVTNVERIAAARRERFRWLREVVLTGRVRLRGSTRPWRRVRLAEILHEHGATSTGAEPVYSVSVHQGLVDQIQHLGRSFAAASTHHYNRVKPGDIVYTKSPTGDFPLGIIKRSTIGRDVIVSPLYGVFTPVSRELGVMLDALFSSPAAALRYLTPLVQKGAKNTISVTNTQFLQGPITIPGDDRETAALASLVESALEQIATTTREIDALRRQKRGLMQNLLTGNLRVPVPRADPPPANAAAEYLAKVAL